MLQFKFRNSPSHGSSLPFELDDVQRSLRSLLSNTSDARREDGMINEQPSLDNSELTREWQRELSYHSREIRQADRQLASTQVDVDDRATRTSYELGLHETRSRRDDDEIRKYNAHGISLERSKRSEMGLTFSSYGALQRPESYFMRSGSQGLTSVVDEIASGNDFGSGLGSTTKNTSDRIAGLLDFTPGNMDERVILLSKFAEEDSSNVILDRGGANGIGPVYSEDDVNAGFYWEDDLSEQRQSDWRAERAIKAVPLDVCRGN